MITRLWLALAACALSVGSLSAQPLPQPVSGTLHVIWGDPPDGSPVMRFLFTGDDGSERLLDIDDGTIALAGGLLAVNGKRMRIELDHAPPPFARPRARRLTPLESPLAPQLLQAAQAQLPVTRPYVTILCRFSDTPDSLPGTRESYERMMGPTYPGVNHYWTEVTEGGITLNGSIVVGWYTLPEPRSGYVTADNSSANLTKLRDHCTAAADADVHFPTFDGINLQFNRSLDCCSWGGGAILTLDGVQKRYGMTWEAAWASLGVYAHEVGHSLGLPHSGGPYGHPYDSRYDVMSSAGWYREPITGWGLGTHTIGYHKDRLGVIPAHRRVVAAAPVTRVVLERSALPRANGAAQLVVIPLREEYGEVYTVESRRGGGYDAPLASGVVISHVNPSRAVPSQVVDVDGNGNVNDAGAQWVSGELFRDLVNNVTVMIDSIRDEQVHLTVLRGARPWVTLEGGRHTRRVPYGSTAVLLDSAVLHASSGTAWQAVPGRRRVRVLNPTGSGPAVLRWQVPTSGLAPGVYVDTVRVYAPGASGHLSFTMDSLIVDEPTTGGLSVSLSARTRSDSVLVARTGFVDSVRVQFRGPAADSASWSVSRSRTSTLLQTVSGRGNGAVRWYHWGSNLSAGVYVDTLIITAPGAAGSPIAIIDTLHVHELPSFTVARFTPGRALVPQGSAVRDSIRITPTGRWATAGTWQAYSYRSATSFMRWLSITPQPGPRTVVFDRLAQARAPGVYVDTLVIAATVPGASLLLADTMEVRESPLAIRLNWQSRRDSVVANVAQQSDSVMVITEGAGAASRDWIGSVRSASRITLARRDAFTVAGRGTGTSWLRWFRNLTGRSPGLYVDTIRVTYLDSAATTMLIDSVYVLSSLTASVAASSRSAYMLGGGSVTRDSVQLTLSGVGNGTAAWTVQSRAPWLTLVTSAGAGPGWVKWTRSPNALAVGTHVDTIRVTVPGSAAGTVQIIDSLRVVAPVTVVSDSVRPVIAVGRAHADTLRATGGSGSYTWSIIDGVLPPGIALNGGTGVIAGQASIGGEHRATVQATSVGFSGTRALRFSAFEPPRVLTDSLRPPAPLSQPYADTLRASGGDGTYSWSIASGTLPAGLTLSSGGIISGTATQSVTARPIVRVTSATLRTDVPLRLTAGTPIVIATTALRATMGTPFADTLRASGAASALAWSIVQGALPPGITLSATGALSGIPERAGAYAIATRAVSGAVEAIALIQLTVTMPALAESAVIDHLLGGATLPVNDARFLDLLGNRNARVDLGDVRVWLAAAGRIDAASLPALRRMLEQMDTLTSRKEPER